MSIQCDVDALRTVKCMLDHMSCVVPSFKLLEELRWGKENTLSFRLWCATSDVHFQSKSHKMAVYQIHSSLQIFSCPKREGTVIDIQALKDTISCEFVGLKHCWCVTADSSFREVLICCCHHAKDRDVQILPHKFQRFGKCHHEEQE